MMTTEETEEWESLRDALMATELDYVVVIVTWLGKMYTAALHDYWTLKRYIPCCVVLTNRTGRKWLETLPVLPFYKVVSWDLRNEQEMRM